MVSLILANRSGPTLLGGLLGIALSFPVIATFKSLIGTIFPVFRLSQGRRSGGSLVRA